MPSLEAAPELESDSESTLEHSDSDSDSRAGHRDDDDDAEAEHRDDNDDAEAEHREAIGSSERGSEASFASRDSSFAVPLFEREAEQRCAVCGATEASVRLDAAHIVPEHLFRTSELRRQQAGVHMNGLHNGVLLCSGFCHALFLKHHLSVTVSDGVERVEVCEALRAVSPFYARLHDQPLFLPSMATCNALLFPAERAWQIAERAYRELHIHAHAAARGRRFDPASPLIAAAIRRERTW